MTFPAPLGEVCVKVLPVVPVVDRYTNLPTVQLGLVLNLTVLFGKIYEFGALPETAVAAIKTADASAIISAFAKLACPLTSICTASPTTWVCAEVNVMIIPDAVPAEGAAAIPLNPLCGCHVAADEDVAVRTSPIAGVPEAAIPLTFATVGLGYEPLRLPPALPFGGRAVGIWPNAAASCALEPFARLVIFCELSPTAAVGAAIWSSLTVSTWVLKLAVEVTVGLGYVPARSPPAAPIGPPPAKACHDDPPPPVEVRTSPEVEGVDAPVPTFVSTAIAALPKSLWSEAGIVSPLFRVVTRLPLVSSALGKLDGT
jgi:hypothetical protein